MCFQSCCKASLPAVGKKPCRRGQDHLCLNQAECSWAAALHPILAAGAQLSSSNGKQDCSKGISPGPEAVLAFQAG